MTPSWKLLLPALLKIQHSEAYNRKKQLQIHQKNMECTQAHFE
ncbi:hypothetical protein NRI_0635 [Neorickettsia risticii str. Illinois]|uniref:Uncharacterized protein n=1 Tax=Neorickettsia risticii (strain Illinois) TaxID=434131 RepID=C6V5E3_NEORI|nr:hypothetical protein NRI_0635 [Neorickettsia risticii str. Illinois]